MSDPYDRLIVYVIIASNKFKHYCIFIFISYFLNASIQIVNSNLCVSYKYLNKKLNDYNNRTLYIAYTTLYTKIILLNLGI